MSNKKRTATVPIQIQYMKRQKSYKMYQMLMNTHYNKVSMEKLKNLS